MRTKQPHRSDFDSPWKEALDHFLKAFLALFFPHVHAGIDWSKEPVPLDKELHRIARGERGRKSHADKLYKVWLLNGEEAWLLIHIEVQGEAEDEFPSRMFRYNTRAFDCYNHPVVSLAVLTDEQVSWRPERFSYGAWGASTSIQFLMTKLIDWRGREEELKASTNPFAKVVLAHLAVLKTRKDPESRKNYKIQLVKGLYNYGWSAEDVRQLFRVIDWLLDLPLELQQGFQEELHAWEEEKRMKYITSVERFGIEKGIKQGLQQGLQQGLHEGLAAALAGKFGKVDKRLLAKVAAVNNVDELRALLQALTATETIHEFRDRLAAL